MRNLIIILSAFILNTGCGQTVTKNQDARFIEFINSFDEEKSKNILKFSRVVQKDKPMTKEEALRFVYHTDDTTVLYCPAVVFSMETEKITGYYESLRMPDKSLLVDMQHYFLAGYTSFECRAANPSNFSDIQYLHLFIINKGYEVQDSLTVYRGDAYEDMVSGLLNPQNGKIFTLEESKSTMYVINKDLKFEIERERNDAPITNDFMKVLRILGWEEYFLE
ncbi:MAG: hypothetical protein LBF69_02075 [Prevotellaceae bacterium]|jgi:hypothetical protein|nr:hypothetical protein [Prevotellaceae bacterium]